VRVACVAGGRARPIPKPLRVVMRADQDMAAQDMAAKNMAAKNMAAKDSAAGS
jgi:hypothetical protein